jgi:hypothetical protein
MPALVFFIASADWNLYPFRRVFILDNSNQELEWRRERQKPTYTSTSCAQPRVDVAECHPVPSYPITCLPVPSHPIPSPYPISSHPVPSHLIPSHPIPYIKTRAYSNATVYQNLKPIGEEVCEIVWGSTASQPHIDFTRTCTDVRIGMQRCVKISKRWVPNFRRCTCLNQRCL